jgi:hypothetical protein
MSIEVAEQLKQQWTDKYVVVEQDVLELRRFVGLTGLVKTVNMSGRALVQFDGPEDISWYDIDPAYLTEVGAPVKKQAAKPVATQESTSAVKPAAKKAAGQSPLEMARQQGAAGSGKASAGTKKAVEAKQPVKDKLSPLEMARQQDAAKNTAAKAKQQADVSEPAETPKPAGKNLSPLELARQQDAAKSTAAKAKTQAKAPETAEAPKPAGKKLSPLELARQQDGTKSAGDEAMVEDAVAEPAETPAEVTDVAEPAVERAPEKTQTATTGPDGKPLSKIELARLQGPFQG